MSTEAQAPSAEPVSTTADTSTPAEGVSSAEVQEKGRLAAEFEKAMADASITSRRPAGMVRIDRGKTEPSKEAKAETATAATDKPKATEQEGEKPVTQPFLSAGFAKLNRQTKAIERREAELASRDTSTKAEAAKLEADRAQFAKDKEAWQAEQKTKLEELSLLDVDEIAFLEKYAARRGTTPVAVYDKWMRRVLNNGVTDPVDVAAETKAELEKVKAKLEADEADRKKRDEDAAANAAKQKAAADETALFESQKQVFAGWLKDEAAEHFPLIAAEPDAAVLALEVGKAHARQFRAGVTNEDVAIALEYVANSQQQRTIDQIAALIASGITRKWHEDRLAQKAAAQPPAETAGKPEPKSAAKPTAKPAAKAAAKPAPKAEPTTSAQDSGADETATPEPKPLPNGLKRASAGPKTLTHNLASQRSGTKAQSPKDDNERLDRALAHWT